MNCQWSAGTDARRPGPCRAMATFTVAEMYAPARAGMAEQRGWYELGVFCTGHAVTLSAGGYARAMRPLPATYETLGKR